MYLFKNLFCQSAASSEARAVNDNSGVPQVQASRCEADRAHADPYLAEACETKRLVEGARLISSVDGNPAAVLNLMATRERKGRRAA